MPWFWLSRNSTSSKFYSLSCCVTSSIIHTPFWKPPFLSIFQGFLPFNLPITPLKDYLMLLIADIFAPPNASLMGESCEEQHGACGSRLRSVGTFLPRKLLTRVSKSLSGGNMTTDLRLVRIVGCIVRALALSSHCDARSWGECVGNFGRLVIQRD